LEQGSIELNVEVFEKLTVMAASHQET
jgi:hypothetical protein